ncbi:MAG: 23S rRNA (uracil(1939)-C(5))-methyltransferase RlmD, partial [Cyanobium sp.]
VDRHGGGGLRHLALRVGEGSGELLITLITRAMDDLPGAAELAQGWMDRWPALVGVTLNLQPQPDNRLFGERSHTLCGRPWLQEAFAGLTIRIGSDSFFQVNTVQAEAVLPLLEEALGPARGTLIDAYCGLGTYSLPLARLGWKVEGIEQQASAVDLARLNAEANGLEAAAHFLASDVAEALPPRLQRGGVEALLLDPPRKGLAAAVLTAILAVPPPTLLYLSCDPGTLARDLGKLCAEGAYELAWVQPLDFFPNTSHVECLAVLQRRQP